MLNQYKLYLDDERTPKGSNWVIVKSFNEFVSTILENGLPEEVSLDHDLGEDENGLLPTGLDCLKWLLTDQNFDITGMKINIHSSNAAGAANMQSYINTWYKIKNL